MSEELLSGLTAEEAAMLELGVILGQNHAFGLIAGRCSAAQAQTLRRLREEKLFKRCCDKWEDFCPRYLKISRSGADRLIKLWDEFGPAYFELSQLTQVSPETYRAIAPALGDGVLHFNGEAIPLNADNSRKVAAAVDEMRNALPGKPAEKPGEESDFQQRLLKWEKRGLAVVREFEKMAACGNCGASRMSLKSALVHVRNQLNRAGLQIGAV